jgi:hypothetical protein
LAAAKSAGQSSAGVAKRISAHGNINGVAKAAGWRRRLKSWLLAKSEENIEAKIEAGEAIKRIVAKEMALWRRAATGKCNLEKWLRLYE